MNDLLERINKIKSKKGILHIVVDFSVIRYIDPHEEHNSFRLYQKSRDHEFLKRRGLIHRCKEVESGCKICYIFLMESLSYS